MRSWIIALCIAAQLAVLAYMVFGREMLIKNGTRISITTAPIDPRDPFRGDFVRLRYPLNTLSHAPVRWQPSDYQPRKGDKMYAILEQRPGGLYDVAYFSNLPPASDSKPLYLRGRIQAAVNWDGRNQVDVSYGIEQLFVEQGSGVDIEDRRGIRGGMQNAMQATISVGADGSAVLTGHTWSDIAIGLEISDTFQLIEPTSEDSAVSEDNGSDTDSPDLIKPPSQTASPDLPPIRLTVTNVSQDSITLNNPGDNCGFRLEPRTRSHSEFFQPAGVCADLPSKPVMIEAGESIVLDIELASPRWHMSLKSGDVISTADIRSFQNSAEWFRLVYRSEQQVKKLPGAEADDSKTTRNTDMTNASAPPFWQGDLVSQAFSPRGQMD
ncbi:GDYXXLXY domain-containing protein [Granulosicoccus antarcticus]|uniref:Uncharacterized protein n=1 Tax=Granulosicoccus antarcticus IMCC3135 TaxID=1192854 RepID=A0A2Z2P0M8_9GAMM|nr:GDYXXLXY domain-containing protein [Granulosicoccus antarcticus]ASJ74730.1 hypothetical protein IMCC3135_23305 [Granulosicoccus antarcticus IMCC3135]